MNKELEAYKRQQKIVDTAMDEMREAGIKSQHAHATAMFFFGAVAGTTMTGPNAFLIILPFAVFATIINYKYNRRWKRLIDKAERVLKLHGNRAY